MGTITIVGLGPGDPGQITLAAKAALDNATYLFLRTEIHPTTAAMRAWGLKWESFDAYYQQGASFEEVYGRITKRLLAEAQEHDLVYAVPGHPLVAEIAVNQLLSQTLIPVQVIAGLSALDALYARLNLDPNEGLQILDALALEGREVRPDWHTLVLQVYSTQVASEAKLHLMRWFPDDHLVRMVRAAGVLDQEQVEEVPLYEIDRLPWVDYLTTLYLPPAPLRGFSRLVSIIAKLRSPEGCPWDREQTPESLRKYILEEAYETVEAIDEGNLDAIEEELGDLLLQVVLQAQIFEETGDFDIQDVADTLAEKLVRRHPHVFGDAEVQGAAGVVKQWETIKAEEKAGQAFPESALAGVSTSLPALVVSEKLQGKASRVGFDWGEVEPVLAKIQEELLEIKQAIDEQHGEDALRHELGDILTAVVNLARQIKIDPEEALREANARFKRRFAKMEELAQGRFAQLPLEQMEALWQQSKALVG